MPIKILQTDNLLLCLQHREITHEEGVALFSTMERISLGWPNGLLILSEVRGVAMPDARTRKEAANTKQHPAVVAFLADSAVLRGLVTSLGWFLTDVKLKAFDTARHAVPFLEAAAAARGINLTENDRACALELDRLWDAKLRCVDIDARFGHVRVACG